MYELENDNITSFADAHYQNVKTNISVEDNVIAEWDCEIVECAKTKVLTRVVDSNKPNDGTALYEILKATLEKLGIAECNIGDQIKWTFFVGKDGTCSSRMSRKRKRTTMENEIKELLEEDLQRQKQDILSYIEQNA